MVMATTKKEKPKTEETQEQLEQAFQKGKFEGQQEVYKIMADFLKKRMVEHFETKNDELAKELREIYSLIKANIK